MSRFYVVASAKGPYVETEFAETPLQEVPLPRETVAEAGLTGEDAAAWQAAAQAYYPVRKGMAQAENCNLEGEGSWFWDVRLRRSQPRRDSSLNAAPVQHRAVRQLWSALQGIPAALRPYLLPASLAEALEEDDLRGWRPEPGETVPWQLQSLDDVTHSAVFVEAADEAEAEADPERAALQNKIQAATGGARVEEPEAGMLQLRAGGAAESNVIAVLRYEETRRNTWTLLELQCIDAEADSCGTPLLAWLMLLALQAGVQALQFPKDRLPEQEALAETYGFAAPSSRGRYYKRSIPTTFSSLLALFGL